MSTKLRSRFFRHPLGQLEVVPGLHEDHLNLLGLHQTNDLNELLRRRRDPGPVFERGDLDEAEAGQEVDEVGEVGDDLGAANGLHELVPTFHLPAEPLQKRLAVLLERRPVVGREAGEPVHDVLRDDGRQAGVEREVGIAERVHVTHRAIDAGRGHFQQGDAAGDLDPARGAPDDVRVVRAEDGHVGPHIELRAVLDQRVGPPELQHHARPHLGLVEVLCAARERVHLDQVAAHGFGE